MVRPVRAAHVHAELGGDDRLVAPALQRRAEHLLGRAVRVAVDVGRVEEVHPEIQRGVHHRAGTVKIHPTPEVVATESDH